MNVRASKKKGIPAQALQDLVYGRIKERIVDCRMLPGSVIAEDALAEEFGTSRTPVREALLRLQRENLVTIFPRQGTFVSQISLKDIYEVFQVRWIIEPRMARISCHRMDPAVLEEFRGAFRRMDREMPEFDEWFRRDREFHDYIIGSGDNGHLTRLYGSIMDQNQRMRILAGKLPRRAADTNREHAQLVEALLSRSEERIEKAMAEHIIASRDAALRIDGFMRD